MIKQASRIYPAKVIILILLTIFDVPLAKAEDMRIAGIIISGNSRTKESVILSIIKVKAGDIYSEGLEKDIEQRLLNSRMFYDIKVEADRNEGEVKLSIRLKDKWSLIPFPIALFRNDDSRYGIAFSESNLFGYHKRLSGIFFYENNKLSQAVSYYDKNLFQSNYRLVLVARNTNLLRDEWSDRQKISSYYQSDTGADVGIGYTFNNNVTISFIYKLHRFSYSDSGNTLRKPDGGTERVLGLLVDIDSVDYREDLIKGFAGRILVERDMEFAGSDFDRTIFSWRLNLFLNPVFRHNLVLISSGAFGKKLPSGYRFRIGQQRNEYLHELRGYERDRFETDRALVSTVEYRMPCYSFKEATLSFVAFADNAIFENAYQSFTPAASKSDAGISLRLYLRRITAPVFQVYSAYGFSNKKILSGISLGVTF